MRGSVLERFNVAKDVRARQVARFVDALLDATFPLAAKERLGDGIIPTVAATAHAG